MYPLNSWTGNAEFRINLTTNEGKTMYLRWKYAYEVLVQQIRDKKPLNYRKLNKCLCYGRRRSSMLVLICSDLGGNPGVEG